MTAEVAHRYAKATSRDGSRAHEVAGFSQSDPSSDESEVGVADDATDLTSSLIFLFIPLVMASGGNAGSQSATLFIRMFALQPADGAVPGTGFSVDRELVLRELVLAAVMGAVLALLDFVYVLIRFDLARATAVGVTVFLIVILGTTAGTMLPILFRRLDMDPAIMSTPLIAAIVDVLGVVIFYEVAMIIF